MKTSLLALSAVAMLAVASTASAQTLAQFTFETSAPTTAGPFAPEGGMLTASSAQGSHATASTYSSPAGNGSTHSFSSNGWSVGDYYQVTLPNTTGYTGLSLSFASASSATGPLNFDLQYSINGSAYTSFASYTNPSTIAFNATTANANATHVFDLTSLTGLNNSSVPISFRLTDTTTVSANGTGTVAATGTSRIDDFTVSVAAAPVPEPSTYAMMAGGLGLLLVGQRIRRTARA